MLTDLANCKQFVKIFTSIWCKAIANSVHHKITDKAQFIKMLGYM